jgi:hypothetical protein
MPSAAADVQPAFKKFLRFQIERSLFIAFVFLIFGAIV